MCRRVGQQHTTFLLRPKPSDDDDEPPKLTLFGCGHAEFGQLGTGDVGGTGEAARDFPLPRKIPLPGTLGGEPVEVRCGAIHTAILTSTGEVATFGWNSTGALGHGAFGYELLARPIESLSRQRVSAIAAGGRHTVALEGGREGNAALPRDLGAMLSNALEADCVLEAGARAGARRYLVHRCILACRCPRLLAMLAFSSARFAPASGEEELAALHWPSQARGEDQMAGDGKPALRHGRPSAHLWFAPHMAVHGTRRHGRTLFSKQLGKAARRLGLPALSRACDGRRGRARGERRRVDPRGACSGALSWLLDDGAHASDVATRGNGRCAPRLARAAVLPLRVRARRCFTVASARAPR